MCIRGEEEEVYRLASGEILQDTTREVGRKPMLISDARPGVIYRRSLRHTTHGAV